MSTLSVSRFRRAALCALLLAGAARAADPAPAVKDEARGALRDASDSLRQKDYDAAVAKYGKVIDGYGVENSCRA